MRHGQSLGRRCTRDHDASVGSVATVPTSQKVSARRDAALFSEGSPQLAIRLHRFVHRGVQRLQTGEFELFGPADGILGGRANGRRILSISLRADSGNSDGIEMNGTGIFTTGGRTG